MSLRSVWILALGLISFPAISGEVPSDCPPNAATLAESGPIVVTANGQIIENLRITSTSGDAIHVLNATGVTIRNVEILHQGGHGINAHNADRLRIEDVSITHSGAPPFGENAGERNNINVLSSTNLVVNRVRLEKGSSGVYLVFSPNATFSWIEGHDFRGPFPRGQLIQWNNSNDGILEDFSSECPTETSFTEDNVNIYQSSGITIRRGLIDGNNSASGSGVIADASSTNLTVENVDTVRMGNANFAAYPGYNVTFAGCRARDNICTAQNRRHADGSIDTAHGRAPMSGGVIFAVAPGSTGVKILDFTLWNPCAPNNVVWDRNSVEIYDVKEEEFTLREPVRLQFCWQDISPQSPPLAPAGISVQ